MLRKGADHLIPGVGYIFLVKKIVQQIMEKKIVCSATYGEKMVKI